MYLGCFELTYNVETSYADYPSAVAESKSPELKWVEEAADIDFDGLKKYTSLLHVFFKNEHIIQYKRDVLYSSTDFIC